MTNLQSYRFFLVALFFGAPELVFAQQEAAAQLGPAGFIHSSVMYFLMALFVYYLLVLKPQQTREIEHNKFVAELKKNDEVLTSSGIFGRVVQVKPEYITLEVAPNVRLKIRPEHLRKPGKIADAEAASDEPKKESQGKNKKVAKG